MALYPAILWRGAAASCGGSVQPAAAVWGTARVQFAGSDHPHRRRMMNGEWIDDWNGISRKMRAGLINMARNQVAGCEFQLCVRQRQPVRAQWETSVSRASLKHDKEEEDDAMVAEVPLEALVAKLETDSEEGDSSGNGNDDQNVIEEEAASFGNFPQAVGLNFDKGKPELTIKQAKEGWDDCVQGDLAEAETRTVSSMESEETLNDADALEGEQRLVNLENRQLMKLAAAAELGLHCINVKALAAEVGLRQYDVLAWLGKETPKIAMSDECSEMNQARLSGIRELVVRPRLETPLEKDNARPIEFWPGTLSPPDFDLEYCRTRNESSACGMTNGKSRKLVEQNQGADRDCNFEDVRWMEDILDSLSDTGMQVYMEGVIVLEEEEQLARYLPPKPIPEQDVNMRKRVENLIYTLKDVIPGPVASIVDDWEKWTAANHLFSETVELQNPLFCLRGINSLQDWLKVLAKSGAVVDLKEIYYENIATKHYNRWVHAIWTAILTKDLQRSIMQLGMEECWAKYHGPLFEHFRKLRAMAELVDLNGTAGDGEHYDKETHEVELTSNNVLQLSGEASFELDESGQVTSIHIRWYKIRKQSDLDLASAELWLAALLGREM